MSDDSDIKHNGLVPVMSSTGNTSTRLSDYTHYIHVHAEKATCEICDQTATIACLRGIVEETRAKLRESRHWMSDELYYEVLEVLAKAEGYVKGEG